MGMKAPIKELRWIMWLLAATVIACIPGILLAPYSINTFDEPYQILNAFDCKNSVYSPLSALLGHFYGIITGWRYLAFRYLLIFLLWLSVFISSAYTLLRTDKKRIVIMIGALCSYFATAFKSDMNIYGWDHWSSPMIVAVIIILISFVKRNHNGKIIWLGICSGLTVLMRLPNLCIIPIVIFIFALYFTFIDKNLGKFIRTASIYGGISLLTCAILLFVMYGFPDNYIETLNQNPVGAHSTARILKPALLSSLSLLRFLIIMLAGYYVLYFSTTKLNNKVSIAILIVMTVAYFILLIPLRRQVLGNVLDMAISFSLSGIVLLFIRAKKEKNKILTIIGFIILFGACTVAIGSNWGFFKFMAWPVIPLIAYGLAYRFTRPQIYYTIAVSLALFGFSIYAYWRPTFSDLSLKELNYPLKEGVLNGMYTNKERKENIEEIITKAKPLQLQGYEIIPLRNGNEYLWEYLFLKRNPYQRHNFDDWEALNDSNYVKSIMQDINEIEKPVALFYIAPDTISSLMQRTLEREYECVDRGATFSIYQKHAPTLQK